MTKAEKTAKWRKRYSNEVNKITRHYQQLNANAEVITRKPTPEELDYFLSVLKVNANYLQFRAKSPLL